jgi:hypothetical protein
MVFFAKKPKKEMATQEYDGKCYLGCGSYLDMRGANNV